MRRLTLGFALLLLVSACNQPERAGGSAPVDPRRSAPESRYDDLQLEPLVLVTHADYDEWESNVRARGGAQLVYTLYRESMMRRRGDQRTFVRWMLSALDPELDDQFRRGLQSFVQSLMQAPELGADAHYLFGQLAWYQMRRDPLGADAPGSPLQATLLDTVRTSWEKVITGSPRWRGPHGITAADLRDKLNALEHTAVPPTLTRRDAPKIDTFGAEISRRVEAAYRKADRMPPWQKRAAESQEAVVDFYREYEEHGPKRGCQQVDQAMKLVQDPTALGDAYAHCAIDRNNPFSALDQVRRMAMARQPGGLNLVLLRLATTANANAALKAEFTTLVTELRAIAAADPDYARVTGLARWLERAPGG